MSRNRTIPDSEIDAPDPNALLSGTSTGVADYVSPRLYELTNHLGNVTTVFSEDLTTYTDIFQTSGNATFTAPTIRRYREYTPFGLDIEQTADSPYNTTGSYRYGFNGKESDENGEFGAATHYDYGFRVYNPAIARFLSVDPLALENAHQSPYAFADNSPMAIVDRDGGDGIIYLVILDEARGVVNPELIVSHANEIAAIIGLNIEVKVFDHGGIDDINQDFLDETDNYIIIGRSSFEVYDYFKRNNLSETSLSEFFIDNRKYVEDYGGGYDKPLDGLVLGEAFANLQIAALSVAVAEWRLKLEQKDEIERGQRAPSLEELLALALLHEGGHNITGIRHIPSDPDVGFMKPSLFLTQEGIDDVINDEKNRDVIAPLFNEQMEGHFDYGIIGPTIDRVLGSDQRVPSDNYLRNKGVNDDK